MQSLDSSCQEADFIINDTLLRLKVSNNSSNVLRTSQFQGTQAQSNSTTVQSSASTSQHQQKSIHQLSQHQHTPTPPQQNQQTSHHQAPPPPYPVLQQTSQSLLNSSLLHNINQIPSQPPYCIFDGADSPPEYSSINSSLSENLLSEQQLAAETSKTPSTTPSSTTTPISLRPLSSSPTETLSSPSSSSFSAATSAAEKSLLSATHISNLNSITSPSPALPDTLLSTPPSCSISAATTSTLTSSNSGISLGTSTTISDVVSGSASITISSQKRQSSNSYSNSAAGSPSKRQRTSGTATPAQIMNALGSSNSGGVVGGGGAGAGIVGILLHQQHRGANIISSNISGSRLEHISTSSSNKMPLTTPTIKVGDTQSSSAKYFNMQDTLRELYLEMVEDDLNIAQQTGVRLRSRSFVLERLVQREKLHKIVVNLYPGNKGYSLALYHEDRQISPDGNVPSPLISSSNDYNKLLNQTTSTSLLLSNSNTSTSSSSNNNSSPSSRINKQLYQSKFKSFSNVNITNNNSLPTELLHNDECHDSDIQTATTISSHTINNVDDTTYGTTAVDTAEDPDEDANLIEVLRWPYEVDNLLQCIDNGQLPSFLSDLLESRSPNVFYSGCVICQIRDFRQTFPISSNSCDIYHVLLRPTNDTIYSDVQKLARRANLTTYEERLQLESELVLATSEPLCLDPDPNIGRDEINSQFVRQMFNTHEIRRQMRKYSQVSINRKRKIDQFTHNYGLELCDYLQRLRQRPRPLHGSSAGSVAMASGVGVGTSGSYAVGGQTCSNNSSSGSSNNLSSSNSHSSNPSNTNSTNTNAAAAAAAAAVLSSFASKLPKNPRDVIKPIRPPNLEYPPLTMPESIGVDKFAKAYGWPKDTTDCEPQLIEEYVLETERKDNKSRSVIYHIKLSIYQRPMNSEYLGELYVDRDYRVGERNGEACQFSLGTRAHAHRYIQQFTEIFTEEGRKAVEIRHYIPDHPIKITHTGMSAEHKETVKAFLQQQRQQQAALAAAAAATAAAQQQAAAAATVTQSQVAAHSQLQHNHSQQQQMHTSQQQQQLVVAISQQQQQQVGMQQHHQLLQPIPVGTAKNVNINLQGANIVGITTAGGTVQHIRQQQGPPPQYIDANGATVQVQTSHHHPTHQLSLSNGSLVLVQQQSTGNSGGNQTLSSGLTIQSATGNGGHQQQKAQVISTANAALRSQLSASGPILQAQLKAGSIGNSQQQQHSLQQKASTNTIHSNPAINALVTSIMNTASQWQQQQQQHTTGPQQTSNCNQQQQSQQHKSSSNASILSLLNSAPAAMTSTPVASGTFTSSSGQQQTVTLVQHQPQQQQQTTHQAGSTDNFVQQQQPMQRKSNEVLQNLLHSNLRKINIVSGNPGGGQRVNAGANVIAVSAVGLNQDGTAAQSQNVRVSMSALASQLASPPAIMTNANFGYATGAVNNNSIKILSNASGQRVITANTLRRDSTVVGTAAPSPGSDSNASNTSSGTNLNFTMPGLNALLATSPSPSSDHSQSAGNNGTTSMSTAISSNQTLLERLNSGNSNVNNSSSPGAGVSPQQQQQQQQYLTKTLVQQISNAQSPAASISPMSSPPPQASPSPISHQQQQQQPQQQTATLNLQSINLSSLQGAMANFPGVQNVQVQIPGLTQPISLQLSGGNLTAQQNSNPNQIQNSGQQTRSLLVSVPVTSTTQVNSLQPGIGSSGIGSRDHGGNSSQQSVGASAAGTQTVVLTNAGSGCVSSSGGSMLSLPIAQIVASSVKNLNPQTIRTSGGLSGNSGAGNSVGNSGNTSSSNINTGGSGNQTSGNCGGSSQSIQLLNTLQQGRSRNIQVVGAKPITNRQLIAAQRSLAGSTLKIASPITSSSAITTTANLTATPLVMTTQKLQLKSQKQTQQQAVLTQVAAALQQRQQQQSAQQQNAASQSSSQQMTVISGQQQQSQQQQQIQITGRTATGTLNQRTLSAIAVAAAASQNQKRRRSATDVNK